jgi:uncharacterized protein (TIGR04551 family)
MHFLRIVIAAVLILGLALPLTSFAQEEEKPVDKAPEDKATNKPDDKPQKQKEELKPLPPPAPEAPEAPETDEALPVIEPEPLPPPPEGFEEVSMDEFNVVKPPLNVLDLHGYFRFRGDLMKAMDLGLHRRGLDGTFESVDNSYPQFTRSASNREDTLTGANIRFRLEPTINISEDVRIMAQIDMLDNLVLGSTPAGYPANGYTPIVALSDTQHPPVSGLNSVKDSILVKRVWGDVRTPVGTLRFGRMGSHWGLGMLANDGGPVYRNNGPYVTNIDPFSPVGQCFDCDHGSTVDRILFITNLFGHHVIPMIDFSSEGPTSNYTNGLSGQPVDLDQLDDVNSYSLIIEKRDKPEDIRDALEQDEYVLNYGVFFTFRNQALDAIEFNTADFGATDGESQAIENFAVRDMQSYIPDIWVRLMWGKLRIELEFAAVFGKIKYDTLQANLDSDGELIDDTTIRGQKADLLQLGGVLQADYTMLNNQLILGMEIGFASGDDSPGFGINPFEEDQQADQELNNFRFNLDYHVDMILWRNIIGTVTDALYFKPSLQYNISEGLGTKVSAIYSSAIYKESTRGKEHPLGLEFDLDFFYFSGDHFHAGISYGILIPLAGMNDLGADQMPGGVGDANSDDEADIAHRIMARMVLFF